MKNYNYHLLFKIFSNFFFISNSLVLERHFMRMRKCGKGDFMLRYHKWLKKRIYNIVVKIRKLWNFILTGEPKYFLLTFVNNVMIRLKLNIFGFQRRYPLWLLFFFTYYIPIYNFQWAAIRYMLLWNILV